MARRSKKLREADEFRAVVIKLLGRNDVDWRPYEEKWLRDEAHRRGDYVYTDRERKVLNRLLAAARVFSHYSGFSVQELVSAAYAYRADLDLHHEEFLTRHHNAGTVVLPVRDIRYLASLYRKREHLDRDDEVEAVFAETWTEDTSRQGYEEPVWGLLTAAA